MVIIGAPRGVVIIGAPRGVVIIGAPRGVVIIGAPRGVVIIRRGLYANSEVRLKPDFAVLEYQYLINIH